MRHYSFKTPFSAHISKFVALKYYDIDPYSEHVKCRSMHQAMCILRGLQQRCRDPFWRTAFPLV